MGVIVKVPPKNKKEKFTIEYTDEEVSPWKLSEAEWDEGYWRKVKDCDWVPPSMRK